MTYGNEIWITDKKKTKNKMRAVEMKYQRICCEITS